ncbi:hypothetical protein [Kingella oralis]|jgi:nuclear mitotic apparatus protein 1|uniref:M protein repeat protein n=1 Tax=Kingella oralis ATCC 51147 TaxID=629741 RepID=C4GHD9_9NEIS|nr:hypothetical protein [Kingella oralis]EEP68377.1 hypothetical protein GCWU000324_00271 [Kingella oralis ATCC 51147]QMT42283.1 hypothetical protein H3L93_09810 [Kingella oralis]
MNTLKELDTLESKIKALASKLHYLYEDNQKLKAKLVVERREYDAQVLHWEEQLAAAVNKANTANDEELNHKLQFQEQQIKLLETERINLRDQISFLQNTIQNKEKNWQERFTEQEQHGDKIQELQEQLQSAEDSALVLRQELTSQKQQASEAQKSNAELTEQLAELQAQLSEAEHRIAQYDNETAQLRASLTDAKSEWQTQEKSLLDSVNAEKEALATQLAQEAERFRMEFALQTEQHEKSLNELNQMFNQQKEHLENENTQLQQQVEQLITQNHAYRALLQENANKIRALLDRLPALENNHEETIP